MTGLAVVLVVCEFSRLRRSIVLVELVSDG